MNYVKQRDLFRCGPVAIMNALRWAGLTTPYNKTLKRLTKSCRCEFPRGTKYRFLSSTLRQEGKKLFNVKLVQKPSLRTIERAGRKGNAILWNFKHERGRHYALIVGVSPSGKTFNVVNYYSGSSLGIVSRHEIKDIIRQRDNLHRIWILSKK